MYTSIFDIKKIFEASSSQTKIKRYVVLFLLMLFLVFFLVKVLPQIPEMMSQLLLNMVVTDDMLHAEALWKFHDHV